MANNALLLDGSSCATFDNIGNILEGVLEITHLDVRWTNINGARLTSQQGSTDSEWALYPSSTGDLRLVLGGRRLR